MSFLLLIICSVIVVRRLKRRVTIAVPAVVGMLALASSIHAGLALAQIVDALSGLEPDSKATVLAAGISEALSSSVAGLIVVVPVVAVAWVVDSWLRKRERQRSLA